MTRSATAAQCAGLARSAFPEPTAGSGVKRIELRSVEGGLGAARPALRVGCLVRTGENFHPHFEIIALSGDKAWVRDVQYGTDHVVQAEACRLLDQGVQGLRHAC